MGFTNGGFSGTGGSNTSIGSGGIADSTKINIEEVPYTTPSDANITNVKDALDSLFYTPPSINSFTISPNTVEKGTVITDITFNWGTNKNVVSQSINQGIGEILNTLRTYSLSGLNITGDISYSLTISDNKNTANRSSSISFRNKRYWGVSNLASLNNGDILSLSNSELSTSKSQSKTFNTSNQYIYFAFPSSFGNPTFKVNGLDNDAWIKTTILFTNSKGYKENYDVYRSEFLQNGIGITVDVT